MRLKFKTVCATCGSILIEGSTEGTEKWVTKQMRLITKIAKRGTHAHTCRPGADTDVTTAVFGPHVSGRLPRPFHIPPFKGQQELVSFEVTK